MAVARHTRSACLQAPTYWIDMSIVEARIPLLKSWFDQVARAPQVSITEATTPPW